MIITPHREIHIPGSLPKGMDISQLWSLVQNDHVSRLADDMDLRWLADYTTRKRQLALGPNPKFRLVRDGNWDTYDDAPLMRPLEGGTFETVDWLVDGARINHDNALVVSTFATLRGFQHQVQLSRPLYLDMAWFMMAGRPDWRRPLRSVVGVVSALRNRRWFREAAQREVYAVFDRAETMGMGEHLRWSLETQSVLYALNLPLGPLRPLLARWLAGRTFEGLLDIPEGQAILHLCYGRLNGELLTRPYTTAPLVAFLNALAHRLERAAIPSPDWPPVHCPIAYGDGTVPLDSSYYAPLQDLHRGWRMIAGVVDPQCPTDSSRALQIVESRLGHAVYGVSTPCGWGQWSQAATIHALALLRELSTQNVGPVILGP